MSTLTVSQKIAIIKEIANDSRDLWLILNESHANVGCEEIKNLFIDIINRDSNCYTRFRLDMSHVYLDDGLKDFEVTSSFDMLAACYKLTSVERLSYFLFV